VLGRRGEENECATEIVAYDWPNGAEDVVEVLDGWIEDECDVEVHANARCWASGLRRDRL